MAKQDPVPPLAVEPEVERALIGRVIFGRHGTLPDPPPLPPSRFGVQRHQIIWAAILGLQRHQSPWDVVSVGQTLKDSACLKDAGGMAYLGGLEPDAGTVDSLEYYVQRIQAAAARRALARLGSSMRELATLDPDRPEASVKARYQMLARRAESLCDLASANGHPDSELLSKTIYEIATAKMPVVPWIYQPWMASRDLVLLAGEPGLGKSWIALDLMLCLMLAKRCLGSEDIPARRQRVLYVDEENNPWLVHYRICKILNGFDIGLIDVDPANAGGEYMTCQGVNLDDEGSLIRLKRKLERTRPDWVILDSLVGLHRRDENSNSEMSELFKGIIKPLLASVEAGGIIIHHLAKPSKDRPSGDIRNRIRGASSILGHVDQAWGLEKVDEALRFTHVKGRMGVGQPLSVRLEDSHQGFGIQLAYAAEDQQATETIAENFESAAQAGVLRQTLSSILDGIGYKASARVVGAELAKLYAAGKLKKRREGHHMRYWLSEYAPPDSE